MYRTTCTPIGKMMNRIFALHKRYVWMTKEWWPNFTSWSFKKYFVLPVLVFEIEKMFSGFRTTRNAGRGTSGKTRHERTARPNRNARDCGTARATRSARKLRILRNGCKHLGIPPPIRVSTKERAIDRKTHVKQPLWNLSISWTLISHGACYFLHIVYDGDQFKGLLFLSTVLAIFLLLFFTAWRFFLSKYGIV